MRIYIGNPVAGRGRGARILNDLPAEASRHGVPGEVWPTAGPGEATMLARRAAEEGATAVIAVGGDGTANEVANGLLSCGDLGKPDSRPAMGLVPVGSGDDLARALHLSRRWPDSLRALQGSQTRTIDVGCVRARGGARRYFLESSGTGFDAYVASLMARERLLRGAARYVKVVVTGLWTYRNAPVQVVLDDVTQEATVLAVAVTNGAYFAGGMMITPAALLDDGQLDVAILGDLSKLDTLVTLPKVYSGRHVGHPKVSLRRGRRVRVVPLAPDSGRPLIVHADGEFVGEAPAEFEVIPAALRVLAPAPGPVR